MTYYRVILAALLRIDQSWPGTKGRRPGGFFCFCFCFIVVVLFCFGGGEVAATDIGGSH